MHKARAFFFVCVGLLALLLPLPAAAAWPNNPLVNVPLCSTIGDQYSPTCVSDGAGGAIVAWHDYRSGNSDIYAQKISATGAVQWTANGAAICTATGDQYSVACVSDGAGGAIVTWMDWRSGTNADIYAQRISATGAVQWPANGVALCVATSNQWNPTIALDGAGGAIVTWQDYRSGNYDIYAQRISATGAVQWTANGAAICTAANEQVAPTIAPDGAGGAIVTWHDYRSGLPDIYAQRISAGGAAQWAIDGAALCIATGYQRWPTIVSDGAGGAIVTWQDERSGFYSEYSDIYAQKISATGAVQWATDGAAICTATGEQSYPTIVSDGTGGAIVTWWDYRGGIYSQKISAGGAVQWTADGAAICTATAGRAYATTASDGAGGAIVTWVDGRSNSLNIYAQRISVGGTVRWTADGVAICTATSNQGGPTIVSDGAGGAIVTWYDGRSGGEDIYAQGVDQWGYLGVQPAVASVKDVPNDQGGRVKLSWYASPLDSFPGYLIADYLIYRSVPPNLAAQLLREGAVLATGADTDRSPPSRTIIARTEGALTAFWEYIGTVSASHKSGYSYLAPTACDSVGGSNPRTLFMVEAITPGSAQWWDSDPDSGYSVDNLAPPAPALFTGQYAAGTATLHWTVNPAADLAEYRLYRGGTPDFVPGPGNLVVAKPDAGYVDVAGAPYYYKLCAVDVHENASDFTLLLPSGTVDVPSGGSLVFALEGVRPNPSHGERLSVAFTLPTTAPARVELLDVTGRRVVEREVGSLGAGQHTLDLGEGQHLAPGLYLVRLTQGANKRTTRVAVLR